MSPEGEAIRPQIASERPVEELVLRELRSLRDSVAGIQGSLVTTSDGLLVTHDISGMEPSKIAAIVATTLGLASQATLATGRGPFREAVARGSDGYLVAYAAGPSAVIAVIGDTGLNVGMLHYEMRDMVGRIASYASKFPRWGNQWVAEHDPEPGSLARKRKFLSVRLSPFRIRRSKSECDVSGGFWISAARHCGTTRGRTLAGRAASDAPGFRCGSDDAALSAVPDGQPAPRAGSPVGAGTYAPAEERGGFFSRGELSAVPGSSSCGEALRSPRRAVYRAGPPRSTFLAVSTEAGSARPGTSGAVSHRPARMSSSTQSMVSLSAKPFCQARSLIVVCPSICQASSHCSLLITAHGRRGSVNSGRAPAGAWCWASSSAFCRAAAQAEARSRRRWDPIRCDLCGQNRTSAAVGAAADKGKAKAMSASSVIDHSKSRSSPSAMISLLTRWPPMLPCARALLLTSVQRPADSR
jgi:uncharacterized protein